MRIAKILYFKPVPLFARDTLRMIVYQDSVGWYYPKRYVECEGFRTPFCSVEELELITDCKLALEKCVDVDVEIHPIAWLAPRA